MKQPSKLVLTPEETARFEAAIEELLVEIGRVDRRIRRHQSEIGRMRREAEDRAGGAERLA